MTQAGKHRFPPQKAFIGFLLLLAFASNTKNAAQEAISFWRTGRPDEVSRYERQYDALRPVLSRQTAVGYLNDAGFSSKHFTWARYTVTPTFVCKNTKPEVIIAELRDPARVDEFCHQNHYRLLVKGSGHIMLLERTK